MEKYTYNGEIYYYNNGAWYTSSMCKVPSSIEGYLNNLIIKSVDYSGNSVLELMSIIDGYIKEGQFFYAADALEKAFDKADADEIKRLLYRYVFVMRRIGRSQNAIETVRRFISEYGPSLYSYSLLVLLADSFCDLGDYEEALHYANLTKSLYGMDLFSEYDLTRVYERIKSHSTVFDEFMARKTDRVTKADVEKHGIIFLCHFTNARNLNNILKYGILPKKELIENHIPFWGNDSNRYEGCTDATCLSISFPNYRLFYKYRTIKQEEDWVVLRINPDVLFEKKCTFSWTNAASSRINNLVEVRERAGRYYFDELFENNAFLPDAPSRERMQHNNIFDGSYPTNPQAEVLVFDRIETGRILDVCFENENQMQYYREIYDTDIPFVNEQYLFKRRFDAGYWGRDNYG